MKPVLALSFLVILLCSSFPTKIIAQEAKEEIRYLNSINFFFINGYAVSYKFKNSNLRLHFDLSSSLFEGNSDGSNNQFSSYDTTFSSSNSNSSSKSFSFSISPQYLLQIYKNSYARIYTGVGPFLGYNYSISKDGGNSLQDNPQNNYTSYYTHKRNSLSFGLSTFIGIETPVKENINVFAETHLIAGKSWIKYKSEHRYLRNNDNYFSNSKNDDSENRWFANLTNVRIGLGIYF